MTVDLDKSGSGFQQVRTWLGPSLGWSMEQIQPQTNIVVGGTYTVQPGDSLIAVNVAAVVTVQLPDVRLWVRQNASQPATGFTRALTIKDLGGNAGSNIITIIPFGTQLIDGTPTALSLNTNHAAVRLLPLIDLTGWLVDAGISTGGVSGGGDVFKAANNTFTGHNTFSNITTVPTVGTPDNSNNAASTAFVTNAINAAGPFQPLDADLSSIAGASATNVLYYRSAPDTWSPVTIGPGLDFTGGVLKTTGAVTGVAAYFFEAGQY